MEAVQIGAAVGAIAHGCVTVRDELVVVGTEGLPGLLCRLLQHYDHVGTHEERRVALLVVVQGRVVVDLVVLVL